MRDFNFKSEALEADEEEATVAWATNHGWTCRKVKYIGRNGCPDRHFYGYGAVVMIEFKRPGKRLSKQQAEEHERLRKAGLTPHACDTAKEAIGVLRSHMK